MEKLKKKHTSLASLALLFLPDGLHLLLEKNIFEELEVFTTCKDCVQRCLFTCVEM